MKTSLICLLLLAAVACAAPQAVEMPGEKRSGMAEKMREKMAEKRKEIAEKMRERAKEHGEEMSEEKRKEMAGKMREMAEKKREDAENAVAAAKSDGEDESRSDNCHGYCAAAGRHGCYHGQCDDPNDIITYGSAFDYYYYEYISCVCCSDYRAPYCY